MKPKNGEQVWTPAVFNHDIIHSNKDTFQLRRWLPDHPALPKFAEWVTSAEGDQVHWQMELTECLEALDKLPAHDQLGINPMSLETLRSLVKALGGG